jgi:hypothetical protein
VKVEQTLNEAGIDVFESSDDDPEIAEVVVTVNTQEARSSISDRGN